MTHIVVATRRQERTSPPLVVDAKSGSLATDGGERADI
jgi:hypothetical protein